MKTKLKIGYLTSTNPNDRHSWSGTHYYIYKALQNKYETVIALGPYEPKFLFFIGKVFSRLSLIFLNKRYNYAHSKMISKAYARYFDRRIDETQPDIVVAPSAAVEIAYLKTKVPVIYVTDSTVQISLNYHKALSKLYSTSIKESNATEQLAIDNSALVVISSQWAADSVTDFYKKDKDKVLVLPFGANLENIPVNYSVEVKSGTPIKLLFIGTYWINKGGEYAYNCLKELLKEEVNAELTIIGCVPPEEFAHEKIKVIPFINKNEPGGQKQLMEIYAASHFLILPTRFDCTPIVICEASAFALPVLGTNTGGMAGHVKEGVNGYLFDINDTGKGYAKKIMELIKDEERYKALAISSRKLYEDQLNWEKWTEALEKKINALQLVR